MLKKIIICVLLNCGTLSAGTIDINKSDNSYTTYGKQHECVVEICGEYDPKTKFRASAVIIKPTWVLTAAHIVKKAKNCSIKFKEEEIQISCITSQPDYDDGKFAFNDIAICKLSKPVEINFYPQLYDKNDEKHKICSISGFGLTGPYQISQTRKSDGIKRAGTNIINRIENHILVCSLKDKKTDLEFLICHGDSGGGLFIDQKLAGINSCIFSDDKNLDSNIDDESGHTRVSIFVNWINETIKKMENCE
jgi:V8-like Glu-specific endopeptidase